MSTRLDKIDGFIFVVKLYSRVPTISIRLTEDEFNEIDKYRHNVSKAEYYRQIIDYYISQHDDKKTTNSQDLIQVYERELEHLKQENLKLLELLHEAHTLQAQAQQQKALLSKAWWQFWKK